MIRTVIALDENRRDVGDAATATNDSSDPSDTTWRKDSDSSFQSIILRTIDIGLFATLCIEGNVWIDALPDLAKL